MKCSKCGHDFPLFSTGNSYLEKGNVKCPECDNYVHYYFSGFSTNVDEYKNIYQLTNTVFIIGLLFVFYSPAISVVLIFLSQLIFGFSTNFLITKWGIILRNPKGYELNKRHKESLSFWFVMAIYILAFVSFSYLAAN